MYARLRMSFWKHDPPNPTDAFKNFGPILESFPSAYATWDTSAPVASHSADMELMEEILCARNAFAASFESSADHKFAVMILSCGTQFAYTSTRDATASVPSCPSIFPPIKTRSGAVRSSIAVPSARNSGLDKISNRTPLVLQFRCKTFSIASAVRTGTVDFSTMILFVLLTAAIVRAADSQYVRSAALPFPRPVFFVGVFTETKIISLSAIAPSTSVVKNKFFPRHCFTISSSPGS
mmetsp:Transcript_7708/g.28116  ORF Transcript_7708/g.28116 Transcript_7708/m.28116 type:complete len:237 (+) Transcript_7708:677-1387(+)